MKKLLCPITTFVLFMSACVHGQDKGVLLAGSKPWTVTKSEEAPPGTKLLFSTDGKLTISYVIDGKTRSVSGTYTLAGDKLTLKLAHNGRERVETRTVKKLTGTVLITEDKNRKLEQLERP